MAAGQRYSVRVAADAASAADDHRDATTPTSH